MITDGKAAKGALRLMDSERDVRRAFAGWHESLLKSAVRDGSAFRLPEERIAFRPLRSVSKLRLEFWIGRSQHATVQINEPKSPSSETALSGIGIAKDGKRFLLRQGTLHENNASERIDGDVFAARTGLPIVQVMVGDQAAKRQWHVVSPLDGVTTRQIRAATADFVDRCETARTWGKQAAEDQARLTKLFGKGETGGWSMVTPDPTPRAVLRAQGEVWEALERVLGRCDIEMRKPRHARRYEVDAEILAAGGPHSSR